MSCRGDKREVKTFLEALISGGGAFRSGTDGADDEGSVLRLPKMIQTYPDCSRKRDRPSAQNQPNSAGARSSRRHRMLRAEARTPSAAQRPSSSNV